MSNTNVVAAFETFFESWLSRQQNYLNELLSAQQHGDVDSREDHLKDLITRVLAHYQQYYEEKSRVAQRNIFLVLSPTWFTSLERTFLWIGGFKPTLAFRLVNDSVNDLSQEQRERMSGLRGQTRMDERMLNDEMAKIQESVAAEPLMETARRWSESRGSEDDEAAIESLRLAMEAVVASADSLRMNTAAKVAEILNPEQNVKFLAAATRLHLRIRSWGLQIDREREER